MGKVAVGPTHTPALYSTFLKALISVRAEGPTRAVSPHHESLSSIPGGPKDSAADTIFPHHGMHDDLPQGDNGSLLFHGANGASIALPDFQSTGEMGPAVDISTFPPTMAPNTSEDPTAMLSMDSILSSSFWDSVLVPGMYTCFQGLTNTSWVINVFHALGYSNTMEGLSGGFVYGAMGSGLITPRLTSPAASGRNTPIGSRNDLLTQNYLDIAFTNGTDQTTKA